MNNFQTALALGAATALASTCSHAQTAPTIPAPGKGPYLVLAHYMPSSPPLAFSPTNDYWWNQPFKEAKNDPTRPILYPRAQDHEFGAYVDEVRLAKSYGIDGFLVDQLEDNANYRASWQNLLRAAEAVGGFKIGLMPDYATLWNPTGGDDEHRTGPEKMLHWIELGKNSPAQLRYEGLPVVAPYGGGHPDARASHFDKTLSYAAGEKKYVVDFMAGRGTPIAYLTTHGLDWPMFQQPYANDPAEGLGTFAFGAGSFSPLAGSDLRQQALDYWPRSLMQMSENSFMYRMRNTGPRLSTMFRENWAWTLAHRDRYRWMQLITWNDWGETALSPSVNHGMAWQPITRYYADWLKSGKKPAIARDTITILHRPHPFSAQPTQGEVHKPNEIVRAPADEVEALGMLRAPATLVISTGGQVLRKNVGAGVQSFIVPFRLGVQQAWIERGGKVITHVTSPIPVHDRPTRQNLWFIGATSAHPPRAVTLDNWSSTTGQWTAGSSKRVGTGLTLAGEVFGPGNYAIAATMAPRTALAGVVARAYKDTRYQFTATRQDNTLRWQIARADKESLQVLDEGTLALDAARPARLKLSAVGPHLIGFINDALVSSNAYDSESPNGQMGLLAEGEAATFFDVRVAVFDPALPSNSTAGGS